MARTTITITAVDGFNVQEVIKTFSQIVESYGYKEKMIKDEPCWSKGDGVIAKQQNFGIVIGQREILLQGWMNDAVTRESDLEGMVAVIPKKKMKELLNVLQMKIGQIASVKAIGDQEKQMLENKSGRSAIEEKEEALEKKIVEYKKLLDAVFLQMGKQYFELYKEKPDEKFAVFVENVKDYSLQIEEAQREIKELMEKRDKICPNCGEMLMEGQIFCGYCGTRVRQQPQQEISQKRERICRGCGSVIKEGSNFCGICGTKVTEQNE